MWKKDASNYVLNKHPPCYQKLPEKILQQCKIHLSSTLSQLSHVRNSASEGFVKCGNHWVIPCRQYQALSCFPRLLMKLSYSGPSFAVTLPLVCWDSSAYARPHMLNKRRHGRWARGEQKMIERYSRPWFWTELRVNIFHILSATAILTQSGRFTCVSNAIAIFQSLLLENCSNSHTLNDSSCSPLPQGYHEKAVPYWDYFSDIKGCGRRLLISKPSRYEDINSPGAVRTDPNLQTNIILGWKQYV